MTRDNLIDAIHDDTHGWSCPHGSSCGEDVDCRQCCDRQLAEYEKKIKKEAYQELSNLVFENLNMRGAELLSEIERRIRSK